MLSGCHRGNVLKRSRHLRLGMRVVLGFQGASSAGDCSPVGIWVALPGASRRRATLIGHESGPCDWAARQSGMADDRADSCTGVGRGRMMSGAWFPVVVEVPLVTLDSCTVDTLAEVLGVGSDPVAGIVAYIPHSAVGVLGRVDSNLVDLAYFQGLKSFPQRNYY